LTVVLPIHNGETRLGRCVGEILELASELTPNFSVLIVDDGSTDDTFSAAEELSARYPQVSVRRHRQRRGLGPTLEAVRRRVRSDVVIVHDGMSHIDPNQIRSLWRDHLSRQGATLPAAAVNSPQLTSGALVDVAKGHAALARAHGRLLGFQLLPVETANDQPSGEITLAERRPRADLAHGRTGGGVGQIPPLPRPKFLSALAKFALGE
jgi:hypothetical protein